MKQRAKVSVNGNGNHHASSLPEPLIRKEATIISPLRYPGGKRRLAAFIVETLKLNNLRPKLFVEPFAGGASVALQLLNDGHVEAVALGEKDPLVASFWKVVFQDHEWLIRRIKRTRPTLRGWEYYKRGNFDNDRDRAMACLFLNRTSFSGILAPSAGPIGGRQQISAYNIGCRFNPEALIRRIRQAATLRDKILFIKQGDWKATLKQAQRRNHNQEEVFIYLDPPFYEKAEHLYRFYFDEKDHVALRDELTKLTFHWLLSYDSVPEIRALYAKYAGGLKHINLLYSASSNGNIEHSRELIVTSLPVLPDADRLWRSAKEWKK